MKYFYIHGYGGSGAQTAKNIEKLGIKVEVLGWDSKKDFETNYQNLLAQLPEKDEYKIIASSLGCYYARALAEKKYSNLVLFNPCFDPQNYDFIVERATYNYKFNPSITIAMSIFVSESDEVLIDNVEKVKELFSGHCYIETTNEKHRVTDFSKYKDTILKESWL
ncbi:MULTISPECIES: YqiA/YcfP family alpha/beta fold hydrolase [unclassified Campylobacter]|uniref:YqiA/YcfP family alpha/beta fold hydrolase n=1 Tax=unclassified Campylobacter TaxID=2593542 RepID=UPI0022E9EE20|nr:MULTISPECIES: YqiA/YcfP family alpha/beta fold hydrolase [unclassified Campylobacter]MDA3079816.1 hypothetical protein [Campylobacter sp. CS_NA2]MDA3081424.1 hypothetical protein [Campylobacter sp. CS_NA1]MDA3085917.1 hypothetical protein [Campylobacter sp. CS_ED1]MDA3090650.1 hypothetical protein [Campylobacter sp. CS_ED2]WBR50575.1 hypothetical protein PF026_04240 [Campylobacter sp. CS_NA3]